MASEEKPFIRTLFPSSPGEVTARGRSPDTDVSTPTGHFDRTRPPADKNDPFHDIGQAGDRFQTLDNGSTEAVAVFSKPSETKNLVVKLEILAAQDWDDAAREFGGNDDPITTFKILEKLQRMTARWDMMHAEQMLTQFQAEQILHGHGEKLRIQNYVILERIGIGGMGEVFKVRNCKLDRIEAMKTIVQDRQNHGSTIGKTTQAQMRFRREAQILAQLNHANITTLFDAGEIQGMDFITMEYIKGRDLRTIVKEARAKGELPDVRWALEQILESAKALEVAHKKKIIHRDVKPSNIMLTENGTTKVLDLGIAKLFQARERIDVALTMQHANRALGTPDVMPPEQWADASGVTPASDVYSLGCSLYYLLTGQMPFVADSLAALMKAHVTETPVPPSKLREGIPPEVDALVAKMLEKGPRHRYESATEVIEAIKPILAPKIDTSKILSLRSALVGGLMLTLIVMALAWWTIPKTPPKPTPWIPDGYIPKTDAKIVETTKGVYYDRLVHKALPNLVLILIPKTNVNDPDTFYISENKITNEIFAKFAAENPDKVRDSRWKEGAVKNEMPLGVDNPNLPAFHMKVEEAHYCARWLGGYLPKLNQWYKAAGVYDRGDREGPYLGKWQAGSKLKIAIKLPGNGPAEAGQSADDISIFGVRDMAGNGQEWTRNIPSTTGEKFVPRDESDLEATSSVVVGNSYFFDDPFTFKAAESGSRYTQPYNQSFSSIGFRIVVERPVTDQP